MTRPGVALDRRDRAWWWDGLDAQARADLVQDYCYARELARCAWQDADLDCSYGELSRAGQRDVDAMYRERFPLAAASSASRTKKE